MSQGVLAPTGRYDPASQFNIGLNTWQYEPQLAIGYVDPEGVEATATLSYIISATNTRPVISFLNPGGAHYSSGQQFGIDYVLGYNITRQFELGVSGYFYQQTTPDKLSDPVANAAFQAATKGLKSETVALGLGSRCLTTIGEFQVSVYKELEARNRSQGASAWLRWTIGFPN